LSAVPTVLGVPLYFADQATG